MMQGNYVSSLDEQWAANIGSTLPNPLQAVGTA